MAKTAPATEVANVNAVPAYLQKFQGNTSDADSMASASTSIPRISLKGKKFQFINGDDESKKVDEINVVILKVEPEGSRMVKTFYAGGYNPADTAPPDCASSNGINPDSWVQSPVSQSCSQCPKNVFGSATSPSGKKTKACRDAKRLWVVKADEPEGTVYGLNVPVTSLKAMAEYGKEIRTAGIPLAAIVTQITMDEDSEFPMIHFARNGFLNEEQGMAAIERSAAGDWLAPVSNVPQLAAPAQRQQAQQGPQTIEGEVAETKTVDASAAAAAADNW